MRKKYIILVFISLFLVVGCEDVLDVEIKGDVASSTVFSDQGLTEAFLYQIYGYVGVDYMRGVGTLGSDGSPKLYNNTFQMASVTDEARAKSSWVDANDRVVPGVIGPADNSGLEPDFWEDCYRGIRESGTMLEGLKTSTLDPDFVTQISGEARFLRAMFYFELVRRYGGVPLIKAPQLLGDDIALPRSTASEVYQYIFDELELAAADLPSVSTGVQRDRANKEAAWALNGRAMMYAERWAESAMLSKRVIDAGLELSPDYTDLFISAGNDPEVLFEVQFSVGEYAHGVDKWNWPLGYRSEAGGQTDPTQEMVDSYETIDGLPITDLASIYDPNDPYANRDPRMSASIGYHGNPWGLTPKTGIDRLDIEFIVGRDGLRNPNDGNDTQTGYYLKKFMNPGLGLNPDRSASNQSYKHLRFGEVLLNYAEAQNEAAGPDASVHAAINEIRSRPGVDMPDIPAGLTKDEMRERIRQERKIELAFETHRWYDLIRWRIAVDVLNGKQFHGMKITRTSPIPDPYVAEYDPANLAYDPTFLVNTTVPQVFLEHFYLMPIPQEVMDRNPNLIQNSGY